MSECQAIGKIVHQWEDHGAVAPSDMDLLAAHVGGCTQCDSRYSALIPFLARDSRPTDEPVMPHPLDGVMAEQVIERIHGVEPRRVMRPSWAGLMAACLLVAAGIGAGAILARSTTASSNMVAVRFAVEAPDAASVALVGNFNNWDPSQLMMKDPQHSGLWQITVLLPKDSIAVYNFVIDGSKWITDPRSTAQVNDGFGGVSSVLRL